MNKLQFDGYCCPIFLFEPEQRQGRIINPVTGLIELDFPAHQTEKGTFLLHKESCLSPAFASYLYYLVHEHILFTRLRSEDMVYIGDKENEVDIEIEYPDPTGMFDYATVWFRAPLDFDGLSGICDRMGFSFIDGALYTALYCEVNEPAHNESRTAQCVTLIEQLRDLHVDKH